MPGELDKTMTAHPSPAAPSGGDDAFAVGTQVAGRYAIVRFVAAGGMGEVYEAEDRIVGARVALKAVKLTHSASRSAVDRLVREIALARKVTHPNVCRVHDVGEHGGRAFLTMELLDGETLADRLRRGPVDGDELERIASQLIAALAALHAVGVVHRDVKCSNVMLVPDGGATRVVVTDFGLARSLELESGARLTADSTLLGTPAYMAPEQVEGVEATEASDIYALGVVLFEMTTGTLPFEEKSALATATARLTQDPPRPRSRRAEVEPRWEAAILRCLQRDPAHRPARVQDVLTPGPRSRRRLALALGIGAAAALAAAAASTMGTPDQPAPAVAATPAAPAVGGCVAATSRLEGVWDNPTRARIAARFAASARPDVGYTWKSIRRQLDRHASAWTTLWDAACAASDREADPMLYGARLVCAEARLLELRAHASVLADPAVDVEALSLGFSGNFAMAPVGECSEIDVLRAQAPPPPAAARAAIDELVVAYHRARVDIRLAANAGISEHVEAGLTRLGELGTQAEALGDLSGAGEIGWWHAHYLGHFERFAESDAIFSAVIELAERGRDDLLLVKALAGQVKYRAMLQQDYVAAEAEEVLGRAQVLATRSGNPASARANLGDARDAHARRLGHYQDQLRAATEIVEAHVRADRLADAVGTRIDTAELRSRNEDAAVIDVGALLADAEQLSGPASQVLARQLSTLSAVPERAGDLATALAYEQRALAIFDALGVAASAHVASAHQHALWYAAEIGDDAATTRHLRGAVAALVAGGASPLGAHVMVIETARVTGHRLAAEAAFAAAGGVEGTAAERAAVFEHEIALRLDAGVPFGDEPWAARLAALPPVSMHMSLAIVEAAAGHAREALAHAEAARAALPFDPAARIQFQLGRRAEVIEPLRQMRTTLARLDWDGPGLVYTGLMLGTALLESGDAAGAIEPLEQAIWVSGLCCGRGDVDAQEARFALARALWATGGDHARARASAIQAHVALSAMGPALAVKAERVAAWLAAHRE